MKRKDIKHTAFFRKKGDYRFSNSGYDRSETYCNDDNLKGEIK